MYALQIGNALVGCRVNYVTLTSPMSLTLNFQSQIPNSCISWIVGQIDVNKKKMNQSDTGLTTLPCPVTTPVNLTFKFQIKLCNNLFSIIREPIDMVQPSWYWFPILLFADRFHSKLPVIKLKNKNIVYIHTNIFIAIPLLHFPLNSSFF